MCAGGTASVRFGMIWLRTRVFRQHDRGHDAHLVLEGGVHGPQRGGPGGARDDICLQSVDLALQLAQAFHLALELPAAICAACKFAYAGALHYKLVQSL